MFHSDTCTVCGDCLVECPHLAYPREKACSEFAHLMQGEPSEVISACITCAACNMICPQGSNPFDLINDLQEKTGAFRPTERAVGGLSFASQLPAEVIVRNPGKTAIDLCILGDYLPGVIEGQLFDQANLIKGGKYFCNIGWIHLGRPGLVNRESTQQCVDNLAQTGFETIVCYHDDCFALLANKVHEFGIKLPFQVIHFIEYLRDYVKAHSHHVRQLGMSVAYQQPCASRYTFAKDALLDELFELIGVTRVPRRYDRESALCCTSPMSGSQNFTRDEVFAWRNRNIQDAHDAGAEAMVFLCPMCVSSLRYTTLQHGLKPFMLSNLVRLALGEELTHGGAGEEAP